MRNDIEKNLISNICRDFEDVLCVGIEENKEDFILTTACINFLYELREQGKNANISYFSELVISELYEECKRYLAR